MTIRTRSGRVIGEGQPVYIIAEAGVNHNGSLDRAKAMVAAAAAAGADAIKFQTFKTAEVISRAAPLAEYQRATGAASQYELVKQLELPPAAFAELKTAAERAGLDFLSTPFDDQSLDELVALGMEIVKIPSGELTNLPFLRRVAATELPVLLSTGMADLDEVAAALAVLTGGQVVLLQCTTAYPAPPGSINLRAMAAMRAEFGLPVGLSDHSLGNEIPFAAAGLGACVIEKHFTLDRSLPGPDHQASATPAELQALVAGIRTVSAALGSGVKQAGTEEIKLRAVARKSVVAATDLPAGKILAAADLKLKRPGTGLAPELIAILPGKKLARAKPADEPFTLDDLEGGEL